MAPAALSSIGHRESDILVGKSQRSLLATLVERRSGFRLTRNVETKAATVVASAVVEMLPPLPPLTVRWFGRCRSNYSMSRINFLKSSCSL